MSLNVQSHPTKGLQSLAGPGTGMEAGSILCHGCAKPRPLLPEECHGAECRHDLDWYPPYPLSTFVHPSAHCGLLPVAHHHQDGTWGSA